MSIIYLVKPADESGRTPIALLQQPEKRDAYLARGWAEVGEEAYHALWKANAVLDRARLPPPAPTPPAEGTAKRSSCCPCLTFFRDGWWECSACGRRWRPALEVRP